MMLWPTTGSGLGLNKYSATQAGPVSTSLKWKYDGVVKRTEEDNESKHLAHILAHIKGIINRFIYNSRPDS